MRFRALIWLLLLLMVCILPAQADTVTYEDSVYVFPAAAQEASLLTLRVQGTAYDAQTLEPVHIESLEGAVFGVYAKDAAGAYVAYPDPANPTRPLRLVTGGEPTQVALPLSVDLYLKQEAAPEGYERDADQPEYLRLALPQTVTYVNRSAAMQGVFVELMGDGALGPEPLADIPLVLEGMGVRHALRTDADGRAGVTGLAPGAYTLRQEGTEAGYHIDEAAIALEVHAGEPTVVAIRNSRDGYLALRPMGLTMDGQQQTRLVPVDRAYTVYDAQGQPLGTLRTGETLALPASQQGTPYTLRAAETAEDGFSADAQTHTVRLLSGQTVVCQPLVRSERGFFTLRHVDGLTGAPVPGGQFELRDAQGRVQLTFAADEAGVYTVDTPLPAGRYTVRMALAAEGHLYSGTVMEIDIYPYLDQQTATEAVFESAPVPALYDHPEVRASQQALPSLFDADATVDFTLRIFDGEPGLPVQDLQFAYELPEIAGLSVIDTREDGAAIHIDRRFALPGVEEVKELTLAGTVGYTYAYPVDAMGTLREVNVRAPFAVTVAAFAPSTMRGAYATYGHVYDEHGEAMAGVLVSLGGDTVRTDPFGAYAFGGTGDVAVQAPQGYGVKFVENRAYILPLYTVSGRVQTHGDVQGFPVTLSIDDLPPVTPDALGAFSITGVFDEHATLWAQAPEGILVRVEQTDGQATVHLYAAASISGVAADPDGQPISGLTVRLRGAQKSETIETDAQGRYGFENLYPGTYTLTYEAPGGYVLNEEASRTLSLQAGEALLLEDFSAMRPGSIGGQLLDGEAPYPDVLVTLEPTGQTAVTDAEGRFAFTGLPAGSYTPVFALPEDVILLDEIPPQQISRPAQREDITLHIVRPASISGRIWLDANDDGLLSADEYGLEGVEIALVHEFAGVQGRMTTARDGMFQFEGVVPGNYHIRMTLPEGMIFSREAPGTERMTFGVDSETAESPWYALGSGERISGLMAGAVQGGLVSGVVWEDLDGNGALDMAEPGFARIGVTLLDADGQTVRQVQTDTSGEYRFDHLRMGNYRVLIELPEAYLFSTPQSDGQTAEVPVELRRWRLDATVQAGVQQAAALTGHVRFDRDAAAGAREGYEGMAVALYAANDRRAPVAQTHTDNEGNIDFPRVRPGEYVLCYTLPTEDGYWGFTTALETVSDGQGWTGPFTLGYGASLEAETVGITKLGSISGVAFEDANYSGLREETESGLAVNVSLLSSGGALLREMKTAADGSYRFDGLPAGLYIVECTLPDAYAFTLNRMDAPSFNSDVPQTQALSSRTDALYLPMGEALFIDIGAYRRASVSGALWQDMQDNGRYAASNPPLPGVEVSLLRDGEAIAAVRTDENGTYAFGDLPPGYYALRVTLSEDMRFAKAGEGRGRYSRMPETDNTTGDTEAFYIGNGQALADIDIGAIKTGTVSGRVLDLKEGKGLAGVKVSLLRGGEVVQTQQTGADGTYRFEALRPGAAAVRFETPAGWTLAPGQAKMVDTDVPQGDMAVLPTAQCLPEALLEGSLWLDANANGVWDAGESPLLGVEVALYQVDGEERTWLAATQTDTNGYYVFDKLLPGTYALDLVPPEGMLLYAEDALGPIELAMGGTVEHTLPAYIGSTVSGRVWEDLDHDGLASAAEPYLEGVKVALVDAEGKALREMETNAGGTYRFEEVPPVACRVRFTLPAEYMFTSPAASGSVVPQSDAGTAETEMMTLSMGDMRMDMHAGAIRNARVGDLVWLDVNGNGLQDTDEPGIEGMAVRLWHIDEDGEEAFFAETWTDKNGRYRFDAVRPGTYYVAFTPGEAYLPTHPVEGLEQINSKLPWRKAPILTTEEMMLSSGKHELTMDAGFVTPEMAERFGWQVLEDGAISEE